MQQLLGGDIPEGLKCDVKSLCILSGVPRATLYRSYPHVKKEFELARSDEQTAGRQPDQRLAQIEHLKTEVADLHARLGRINDQVAELQTFKATALSRIAAQHDEITSLRRELGATPTANVHRLTTR